MLNIGENSTLNAGEGRCGGASGLVAGSLARLSDHSLPAGLPDQSAGGWAR
jgi:hypothetical protein